MANISGTAGNDVITGTTLDDVIDGGDGNDRINGGAGNDQISGGAGTDTLTGDAGNDTLHGGDGNDGFFGGGNDDAIYGENGADTMYGDAGNDRLFGGADSDKLYGGTGDDTLDGGAGNDLLDGGAGNDTMVVRPGEGVDTLVGGAGVDTLRLDFVTADLTPALRSELGAFNAWLQQNLSDAGGNIATLSAQTTAASFTFASLNLTVSAVETINVTLNGDPVALQSLLNAAPVADAVVAASGAEDQIITGTIVATDADGDALGFSVLTGPTHGVVAIDPQSGAYVYTPEANYSGSDSFDVTVADAAGASVTQRVSLSIGAVADAPTLTVQNVVGAAVAAPVGGAIVSGGIYDDALVGGLGGDVLRGNDGNDSLRGDVADRVTVALQIGAGLGDLDGSEQLSLMISGVPTGAVLSAGQDNGNGSWTLSVADLDGLSLTASNATDFTLSVQAIAQEATGQSTSATAAFDVTFDRSVGGNDLLVGGRGSDLVVGGAGNDMIYGGDQSGVVSLRARVATAEDNDVLHGGDGNDTVYGGIGDDVLSGDAGNDRLYGGKGNDRLSGGDGDDLIKGDSGNDWLSGDSGNDKLYGGSGFDTLDYSTSANGLVIDASRSTVVGLGNDTFSGIEQIIGSAFADTFKGSSKADIFIGGAGDDNVRGMAGADTFTGGEGSDTYAWFAKDVVSGNKHLGLDHITDFVVGDVLDLHEFTKSLKGAQIGNAVHITDGVDGSTVSVKIGGAFVDLVHLDGVHGASASDWLANGTILA